MLGIKLSDNFEATDFKEVKYTLFRHNFVVLRVHNLDDLHKSFALGLLIKVQFKDLLKEISRLLVSQIPQFIRVKLIIKHLDVEHPFLNLRFTHDLNSLFVVIKYDGE